MQYWTGKGYGISNLTDVTGRPLLTYQGPNDKAPILLSDRVAQTFDFTVRQNLIAGAMKNDRMDSGTAAAAKQLLGGGSNDELDHKISLELGGSNTPANLFIQPGINGGASAASDTLENNLALDVVAGKISLLDAWRTLEEQKGFLLVEDMTTPEKVGALALMAQLAGSLRDYLSGKIKVNGQPADTQLKTTMDALLQKLSVNQFDQTTQASMFRTQVQSIQKQLGTTQPAAQQVVKSYLSGYAQSKGVDPKEMWSATNLYIQQIVDNSKKSPNVFGVPSDIIINIIGVIQSTSLGLVTVGLILAVLGIFIAGPEAVLGALSGGLLESIGAIFGVSALTGIGLTSFAVGEAFNVAAIGLNMSVKSMYDNRYLLPSQSISAFKDALAVQKGLAGFLPSQSAAPGTGSSSSGASGSAGAPTPQPQYTPVSGNGTVDGSWTFQNGQWVLTSPAPAAAAASGGGTSLASPQLFIGHLDAGNLKAVAPYAPAEFTAIHNADDLALAAQQNLGAFLSALPGIIDYQIKTKTSVTGANGTELIGSIVRVQKGTTKKGIPKYKNVTNQFAVAEVFIKTSAKGRVKIEEIVLGPIDETRYKPSAQQLADLGNQLDQKLISTNVANITAVTFEPIAAPAAAPATTTPPSPAVVAPAAAAAPAPSTAAAAPAAPVPAAPAAPANWPSSITPGGAYGTLTLDNVPNFGLMYHDRTPSNFTMSWTPEQAQAKWPQLFNTQTGSAAAPVTTAQAPSAAPQPASPYPRTVTVNVSTLYVRAAPTTTAALAGSQKLVMGNQFQVTGFVHGENVSGEDRWWISWRGDYVWTGGTQEKP